MLAELTVVRVLWHYALARHSALRAQPRDLGASALEWAIISAILVTAAVVIGGVIYRVVQTKSATLETCANQPVGAAGC